MQFSEFLESRRESCRALVCELRKTYPYASILGTDQKARSIRVNKNNAAIAPGMDTECGFVIKVSDGSVFFEYSTDDIGEDTRELAASIRSAFRIHESLRGSTVGHIALSDEPLTESYSRPGDFDNYTQQQLLAFCREQTAVLLGRSENLLNASVSIETLEVSKLFISPNRNLDQHYTWVNGALVAVYRNNDKVVQVMEGSDFNTIGAVLAELPTKMDTLMERAHKLTLAKPIVPGVYDVITDPSISGLIAHEAFGHGVEMDMFVKDRALAREYVGKYVASPIVGMRDGAASAESVASYFFDDDGVLAGDTQIIKDGILVTGISDLASATILGTAPTGNGRRESTRRKAYSRMSNTFFEPGTSKLEDMIASINHGYMLCEPDNGMEDPKNWGIQCTAQYGIEIVDGKLTDNWVAPVVISGYVPDLLKSITMVSEDFKLTGAGFCGKGYKEWARVSDGGPALKVKGVKLG
ncbi:MAG: TldD/PmbA family protein [Oscillospiraceae bacterium]|nr:TldD/PmbA family protein [Oscillospiraceae bacterium]